MSPALVYNQIEDHLSGAALGESIVMLQANFPAALLLGSGKRWCLMVAVLAFLRRCASTGTINDPHPGAGWKTPGGWRRQL